MHKPTTRSGFTLLELSIVLVIIGLIVGGVLSGRELLKTAEIRAAVAQIDSFNTAVMTFRGKYNCTPGDCPNATDYWGQWTDCGVSGTLDGTTCNGDANGILDNTEPYYFWQHLGLANLIPDRYWGFDKKNGLYNLGTRPASKLRNIPIDIGYFNGPQGFITQVGNYYEFIGLNNQGLANYNPFTPDEIYAIDSKMDDGRPGTGIVRMLDGPTNTGTTCVTSDDPAVAIYDIAHYNGQLVCGIAAMIKTMF